MGDGPGHVKLIDWEAQEAARKEWKAAREKRVLDLLAKAPPQRVAPQPTVIPPVKPGGLLKYRDNATTDGNSARTSGRDKIGPYADVGVTSSGDSVYAGAAAIKGRDAKTGIEVEAFSASAQVGEQNEVQVGMARGGWSSDDGRQSVSMDTFGARAMVGIHNPDGSVGLNAGAMATAIGIEGTANYSGNSITGGLSISAGAEAHIGIRDSDGDGNPELSARLSLFFFTVGFAIEAPSDPGLMDITMAGPM